MSEATENPIVEEYISVTLKLFAAREAGISPSEEERIEDVMDLLWRKLSEAQIRQVENRLTVLLHLPAGTFPS